MAWSLLSDEERKTLIPVIEQFIVHNTNMTSQVWYGSINTLVTHSSSYLYSPRTESCSSRPSSCISSFIHLLFECFAACDPVPLFSPSLYRYVTEYFNCGYIATSTLRKVIQTTEQKDYSLLFLLFDLYVIPDYSFHAIALYGREGHGLRSIHSNTSNNVLFGLLL